MPPIVRKGLRSKQSRGFLSDARAAYSDGNSDSATELAAKVFLAEGRDAFGPSDKALFDAMLARLEPPAGFRSWPEWFKHDPVNPPPVDTRTEDGASAESAVASTPLHDAVKRGDLAEVEALLTKGANVNELHRELHTTPLFNAVTEGHLEVAKHLLSSGAKVAGKGMAPVIMGVKSVPMAELILGAGAKLDVVDGSGRTLLTRIVDTLGKVPLAEFIAAKSPVMKDEQQRKVLERAMSQSSPELRAIAEKYLARKR